MMTAEEIIEIRRNLADAARRAKDAHDARPRNPAIRNALDPEILSDELFQIAQNRPNDLNLSLIPEFEYLTSLCQFRGYYESGNGNNWNNFKLNNYNCYLNRTYQSNEAVDSERVHAECWILAIEDVGQDSKLTDGLRFLLNELSPGFGDDEFHRAVERLKQRPNASQGQLTAVRLYREAFKAVLDTFLTGEGEGWLSHFATHPLRAEFAIPKWGVEVNGHQGTIVLQVQTKVERITLGQEKVPPLVLQSHRNLAWITQDELAQNGFDLQKSFNIAGKVVEPFQLSSIRLARVSQSNFHPFLDEQREEIQASELWALIPENHQGSFSYNHETVPTTSFQIAGNNLLRLNLRNLDRCIPKVLTWNGTKLIRIGAAPWLNVANRLNSVRLHDFAETIVVFGHEIEVQLEDYHGDTANLQWTGCTTEEDKVMLRPSAAIHTTTGSVAIPNRGRISICVMFLPETFHDAILNNRSSEDREFRFEPVTEPGIVRACISDSGFHPGILWIGNKSYRLKIASKMPVYWIRKANEVISHDQPLELGWMDNWKQITVECYLPPGTSRVSWAGNLFMEIEGPVHWKIALRDLPFPDGDEPLKLEITKERAITPLVFCRLPNMVQTGENVKIRIPHDFALETWGYSILREGRFGRSGAIVSLVDCGQMERNSVGNIDELTISNFSRVPDQGIRMIMWDKCLHRGIAEIPENPFNDWMQCKPSGGLIGPFTIQQSNPFRSRSKFEESLCAPATPEVPVPTWLVDSWSKVQDNPSTPPPAWDEFLKGTFSMDNLGHHLNQCLERRDNWLANPAWAGPSLINRFQDAARRVRRNPVTLASLKKSCPVAHGLNCISEGTKPTEAWLPIESLRFAYRGGDHGCHKLLRLTKTQFNVADLPAQHRRIKFNYGPVSLSYSESPRWRGEWEWRDLKWDFPINQDENRDTPPAWWPGIEVLRDYENEKWSSATDDVSALFETQIAGSVDFIRTFEQGRLTFVFIMLREWMKSDRFSPARIILFEAAVLCRLHAWQGAEIECPRSLDILTNLVSEAWTNAVSRDILTRDILTVDWAIAWLHN